MTLQQAAQLALDCQDACNLSGVLKTYTTVVFDVLWPYARLMNHGTRWVNTHPVCTLFLCKLAELNGCGSTLDPAYEPAEVECRKLAMSTDPLISQESQEVAA
jgi:hypothetical protein